MLQGCGSTGLYTETVVRSGTGCWLLVLVALAFGWQMLFEGGAVGSIIDEGYLVFAQQK